MAPSCALDEAELLRQAERYRKVGEDARAAQRSRRRLVLDLGAGVDSTLVEEVIAVERECCPFFALRWDAPARRLTIEVSRPQDEPALEAIASALALPFD